MLVCKIKNVGMLSYYQVKEDAGIASHWKKDAGITPIQRMCYSIDENNVKDAIIFRLQQRIC